MASTWAGGRIGRTLSILLVCLLVNAAYLWAFADPTFWYFLQIAIHPILGVGLGAAFVWALLTRRVTLAAGPAAAVTLIGLGLALGLGVLVLGATTPFRRLVDAHVVISTAGAVLLIAYSW